MSERVYTHNGHTFPISWPDKPDWVMAGLVRMLMRDQLNHEAVCVGARDRILCLSQEADTLRAENERLREALRAASDKAVRVETIIEVNLFRQDEKVKDAQSLAYEISRDALAALSEAQP